jgi:hypothetical protein
MGKRKLAAAAATPAEQDLARLFDRLHISSAAMTALLQCCSTHCPQLQLPATLEQFKKLGAEGAGGETFDEMARRRLCVKTYCEVCGAAQEAPCPAALAAAAEASGARAPFDVACTHAPACAGKPFAVFASGEQLNMYPRSSDVFVLPEYQFRDWMQDPLWWESYRRQHEVLRGAACVHQV